MYKDTHGDDLLSAAFNGVLECVNVKPEELGDICVGRSILSCACIIVLLLLYVIG